MQAAKRSERKDMQQVINGLSIGSVYALIALGYSLVFGVMRMINLAHCDIMMIGAYVGYICTVYLGMGLVLSIIWAVTVCSAVGICIEKFAFRPLKGVTGMPVMVVAIGVSLLIEYIFMFIFGADTRVYSGSYMRGILSFGDVVIPVSRVVVLALSVAIMIALQIVLSKTMAGKAMRAVADDDFAAELCGVDEKLTTRLAFALGSALAAVAGVFYGAMYVIHPLMGTIPGIKAFVAAVVGGIGSVSGAVLGGFALGMAETFAGAVLHTAFKDVTAYLILIAVLLFRPGGITGVKSENSRL